MKRFLLFILSVIVVASINLQAVADDVILEITGITENHPAYQKLIEAHPDAEVKTVSDPFLNTELLINAFLSGEFTYDVYSVWSQGFNIQRLIEKGYCRDLSDNAEIRALIARMTPVIADQVCYNDGIYGLPYSCNFEYLTYRSDTWASLGLEEDKVPVNFSEFLDFLEEWIYDIQPQQDDSFCIISTFDETIYTKTSYTQMLVDLLMDRHIMQCNYADIPLRFSDPTFRALLDRCLAIGEALYKLEPEPNIGEPLFEKSVGIDNLGRIVPLMLTSEQPPLIRMNIGISMIYADADAIPLSEEYLLYLLDPDVYLSERDQACLFSDCLPIENKYYDDQVQQWQDMVREIERQLSNAPTREEQDELEPTLERYQAILKDVSSENNKYIISAELLELYHNYSDYFYIQPPHIFNLGTPEGETVKGIQHQLIDGAISVDQFVKRLDEMAWMIELEGT